ncbi:MAG: 16S rRNA (adenine(1518)-N(6)/adenine(1519)-N(6))-dimethyltransferase RsmA [Clostridiales bacterium]|nr:16S rRNA (adenine(1518)-N(6)/adenine(1519)-N(6))-dimethyltransferase RsmA [Clostridiales bacterium]
MNLCDYGTVTEILKRHGFTFSKSLGQNFIVNSEICPRMAESVSNIEKSCVLEIGPGIGALTKELCLRAERVVSVELDKRLFPVLRETLADFKNLEIIEGDVLKLDLNKLIEEKFHCASSVKICANLPYYITSPVIMKLLESKTKADEIVVMVQKEAADRLCAEVGSKNCGAVTIAVNYFAKAEKLFNVSRQCFIPAPKVNSAVIKLTARGNPPVDISDEAHFFKTVKAAFSQRRKTAQNCLSSALGISKETAGEALNRIGRNEKDRAETFTMKEFALLSEIISSFD